MSWADLKKIMKGIVILFIAIMLGVMAAEKQINNLTEYHDFVQACNFQGNLSHGYALYFLGESYKLPDTRRLIESEFTAVAKGYALVKEGKTYLTAAELRLARAAYQLKQQLTKEWQDLLYELENY